MVKQTPEGLLDIGQIADVINVPRALVPSVLERYNLPASGQYKGKSLWLACMVEKVLAGHRPC